MTLTQITDPFGDLIREFPPQKKIHEDIHINACVLYQEVKRTTKASLWIP